MKTAPQQNCQNVFSLKSECESFCTTYHYLSGPLVVAVNVGNQHSNLHEMQGWKGTLSLIFQCCWNINITDLWSVIVQILVLWTKRPGHYNCRELCQMKCLIQGFLKCITCRVFISFCFCCAKVPFKCNLLVSNGINIRILLHAYNVLMWQECHTHRFVLF